ncbi:aldo/keto reductase, partial [Pseudonocardia sp. Ae406_Ps2]
GPNRSTGVLPRSRSSHHPRRVATTCHPATENTSLAQGGLPADSGPLAEIAAAHGVSGSQVAIAWLLARSPTILPIPGTSKVSHLENNLAGAAIELRPVEIERLTGLV